ncbi:DUF1566 domain-containing protein [bacterium]|nr:DUF1566 domain-containing protein [bacterium]
MKKFFVILTLFTALIFVVSCGGGNSSTASIGELGGKCYANHTCDRDLICDVDNNVCVEDPEHPIDDSDRTDSGSDGESDTGSDYDGGDSAPDNSNTTNDGGDTTPDGGDTAPDNGDTALDNDSGDTAPDGGDTEPDNDYPQTPCNPNPCKHIENSTGDCYVNSNYSSYVCGCRNGYYFDGAGCTQNSSDLKECSPTSATPCLDSATGLVWSGQSTEKMHWADAVNYCKNLNEGGFSDWRLPSLAVLRTLVQNCYNSNGCTGDTDGKYSKFGDIVFFWSSSGGSSEAKGVYFYNAASQSKSVDESFDARCVRREGSETRLVNCLGPQHSEWNTVSEITQTWDWDQMWIPSSNGKYNKESSTTECRFKCEENYFWDSSKQRCLNPCDPDMCGHGKCTATSATKYTCECYAGYFQEDSDKKCVNPCNTNPCDSLTALTNKACVAYNFEEYSCRGTDPETNLSWSAKPQDERIWENAVSYCEELNEGSHYDWHLPNIDELKTLLINADKVHNNCQVSEDNNCVSKEDCWSCKTCSQTSNSDYNDNYVCSDSTFYDDGRYSKFGDSEMFYSSSTLSDSTNFAWSVFFGYGSVGYYYKPYRGGDSYRPVRCVRCEKKNYFFNSTSGKCVNPCDPNPCEDNSCIAYSSDGYFCGATGTDTETNLTWSARSSSLMSWNDAVSYCNNLTEEGYSNWHLPTISELRTLIQNCYRTKTGGTCGVSTSCLSSSCWTESTCECLYDPNVRHSKFGDTGNLWSSSTLSDNTAWHVEFGSGDINYQAKNHINDYVRCVKCKDNYFWDSSTSKCVNPCDANPCDSLTALTNKNCFSYTFEKYSCNGTDTETNLTWSARTSSTTKTWGSAKSYCDNLTEDGYSDWRLPTIDELKTLLIASRVSANCQVSETNNCLSYSSCWSCSTCTQTGTQSSSGTGCQSSGTSYSDGRYSKFGETGHFWSSSTQSNDTDNAWRVDFNYGTVGFASKSSGNYYVRCVR